MQDLWAVGATREVQQGKNLADAAKQAGVEHFAYSSVGGAERNSGIDHWESKWEIEKHIRKLGLPATMLRPAAFMDNYYIGEAEIALLKGKLMDPIRADKPYQTIATEDIGAFGALTFSCPRDFVGLELEIAGSELTNLQAAQDFSRVLGKTGQVPEAANADGPAGSRQRILPDVPLVQRRWFQGEHPGAAAQLPGSPSPDAGRMAAG